MMEMSRWAERENSKEEKGSVKTEVPTKVHWAKRKCEKDYRFSNFTLLPIFTDNILKLFLLSTWPYQDLFYHQSLTGVNYWSCLDKQ